MQRNSNGQDELVWRTCSICNGLCHEKTCYKNYLNMGRNGGWKNLRTNVWLRNFD
jgi:hypothetical protein